MTKKNIILGLGGSSHDFSAALMIDNDVICAIEDERITRRKSGHTWWFEYPCQPSIDYCLKSANLSLDDVTSIVTSDLSPRRIDDYLNGVKYYNHHLCHAASIYYLSKKKSMNILVADGMGSINRSTDCGEYRETVSFYSCIDDNLERKGFVSGYIPKERDHFSKGISNSLGYFYNMITRIIGFGKNEEGKTMGLTGYGEPLYYDLMMEHITLTDEFDKSFQFDALNSPLSKLLIDIINKEHYSFQCQANIAASAQKIFEEAMLHLTKLTIGDNSESFGIAGGCALNSLANKKIEEYVLSQNKDFFIYPHVGDAGISFGAAFLETKDKNISILGENNSDAIYRMGKLYDEKDIINSFNAMYPKLDYEICQNPSVKIAGLLSDGEIVALHNGRSEFGPRALGGRSILSNPRSAETRSIINNHVKFREPFRPIAPMVLEEFYEEYFHGNNNKKFMISVVDCKSKSLDSISSVVHIDNTARVQSISNKLDPYLHSIIREFNKKAGVPVVCNTSFNQAGEPIVETPLDAMKSFIKMPINYLVIGNYFFFKRK